MLKVKNHSLGYWVNLYLFRHYKTTIPGLVAIAGGLEVLIFDVLPWAGKPSFTLLVGALTGIATGAGLVAAKDAGQTDAPQPEPVTVPVVGGGTAEVKVADGQEPSE